MPKTVAVLLLSALDNDSRVQKEIGILNKLGFFVMVMSVNSRNPDADSHIVLRHVARRIIVPGLMSFVLYTRYANAAIRWLMAADIIHCNDLNTLPVGVMLKLLSFGRIKVVYDAHEFESNQIPNQSRFSIRMLQMVEGALIRFADAVITVSNGIAEEYARLYNIKKPALVLNCPPYKEVGKNNIFRKTLGITYEQTIFLYQGGLSKGRGIEILLETFAGLPAANVIVFMGYGPLEGQIKEYALAHENIYFQPAVAPDVLLNYTSSADFGILFYENTCKNHDYCSPNKMFEYIMAGIPVIVSNLHEMRRVVEQNAIGVVAQENTVQGLQEAIRCATKLDKTVVRENLGKIKRLYCWEEQEKVLHKVYADLCVPDYKC